jgi:hypothetical protein
VNVGGGSDGVESVTVADGDKSAGRGVFSLTAIKVAEGAV